MVHTENISFNPGQDRSLRDRWLRYCRVAAIIGAACITLALVATFLGGGETRSDSIFHHHHAEPVLAGVVQLLADRSGVSVESYDGQRVGDIADLVEQEFGDELPAQWDAFLFESTGSSWQRFQASYLVAFTFLVSLSLGGLFFVLIQHLTRAGWSVLVRRIAEVMAAALAPLSILCLPILLPLLAGDFALFEWNDPALVETDELLQHKRAYLNPVFFSIRCLAYLTVWALLGRYLLSLSRAQDESGDPGLTLKLQRIAPLGMLLFAITVNFFAFDFLMSLAPHWFSTIYGVYYFSGAVVGGLALTVILAAWLQKVGVIGEELTMEHYHDLGKLLFGFNFFWGYIAFSQYLLIWYANIPEETGWYLIRQQSGWEMVSLFLLFGHLLIPFFGLMSRHVRRNKQLLIGWSCWLLIMHWVDLYWNVIPQFSQSPSFQLLDLLLLVGLGSLYFAIVLWTAARGSWLAVRDPRINESLEFHNV